MLGIISAFFIVVMLLFVLILPFAIVGQVILFIADELGIEHDPPPPELSL